MITTDPPTTPTDAFPTATSISQAETEAVLLNYLSNTRNGDQPKLDKNLHMQFLVRNLVQGFPARYISQDASQPWLLFWTVQAFSILQVVLDPNNKQRVIDKIMACQHPNGGFGGGPGQAPHLLPTYAAVCTLAIVGRPGPNGGWDQIDRTAMSKFFHSLKQPDGSFLVTHHAEVDVRGIYCLLAVATLLDIVTPSLVSGTASFIASCQTYEGGFASASQPYFSLDGKLLPSPRPPLGEAHGGYTFCAVAAWVLLKPFEGQEVGDSSKPGGDEGTREEKPQIDVKRLLRWLVNVQGGASELGGFKGRTNKLVDGCYAWWCGGAFTLVEAFGVHLGDRDIGTSHDDNGDEGGRDDAHDSRFDRKALQEYILYAGQHPAGGLRDKPPKNPDAYHTLYCLSGLSAAQHHVLLSAKRWGEILRAWGSGSSRASEVDTGMTTSTSTVEGVSDELRKRVFAAALAWTEEEGGSFILGEEQNRVNATHPIFNLTITHTEALMGHFYGQKVPSRVRRNKA